MYCSKCGTLNNENAMFCKNCGASLLVQAQTQAEKNFSQQEEIKAQEPVIITDENKQEQKTTENPVIALMKKWAASSLFLTAVILFTVSLGLSCLGGFSFNGTVSTGVSFISVSTVLALIGLWKIRAAAKKQGFEKSSFSLLKSACIIDIVASALVFGLGGIVFTVFGAIVPFFAREFSAEWNELILQIQQGLMESGELFYSEYFDVQQFFTVDFLSIMGIVIGVAFIISCVITIIFNAQALKAISVAKNMAEKGVARKTLSNVFVVFLYVIGGITASSVLSGDIVTGTMGVAYILFGVVLSKFNSELETLIHLENKEQTVEQEPQQ